MRGLRVGLKILIVKRQLPDLDDVEFQRRWREPDQRIRQHPVERSLPQTSSQYAHIHRLIHGILHYDISVRSQFNRGDRVSAGSYVRPYAVAGDLILLVKSGLRFSKKAVSASFASSERTCALNSSFSAFIAALICSRNGCFMSLLLACSASAGFAANFPAVSVALARTSLSDMTWVTRPNSAARLASKGTPSKISSAART